MKKVKRQKYSKSRAVAQQVAVPTSKKITNGNGVSHPNGALQDINSRTFETRLISRYTEMPSLPEGLIDPQFSQSSTRIFKERYLHKDSSQNLIETIAERLWHVGYDIASGEFDFGAPENEVYQKALMFYNIMATQQFLPNSPTLMNAGKQNGLQYSACFVIPVDDSLGDIFDSIKAAALIHQTGGGTGFAFSRLRPSGSVVNSTRGIASGPVSFLRVFDAATHSIKQGGTRRGANMGILRVDHPDVLEFIRCKADLDDQNQPVYDGVAQFLPNDEVRAYFKTLLLDRQISNFNISVAITDKFMEAYFKGEDYDLIDPRTKEVVGKHNAKEIFEEIIEHAWHTGDPGVVFIDRINHSPANPVPELEEIESTNPCGEQPLAPWDACNLGSINLGKFVLEDGSDVDWVSLGEVARLSVNFLDNVVQVNPYTLKQIYEESHRNRRIGLGVMGWADMLFKLKIAYNSQSALDLAERIMKFINEEGHKASQELAAKRGPFPNYPHSIYRDDTPMRNSTVTTIAPTGSISIMGDCSSGIEPVFALAFLHRAKGPSNQVRELIIANQTFEEISKKEGFYTPELAKHLLENGAVTGLTEVPIAWQDIFITAPEIDFDWHVKMQDAFQKYTDNGVSKTINLPNSATREDISNAYLMAWNTNCKGITVYRDGSKSTQVLNVGQGLGKPTVEEEQREGEVVAEKSVATWAPRPMMLRGRTHKIMTPVGEGFVTVNRDEQDQPFEVFVMIGKGGMHTMADAEALGRLVTLSLRVANGNRRAVAQKIVSQLRGIGGSNSIGFGKNRITSLADGIAKVLADELSTTNSTTEGELIPLNLTIDTQSEIPTQEMHEEQVLKNGQASEVAVDRVHADFCPDCGNASFVYEDGCRKCYSCGYSLC